MTYQINLNKHGGLSWSISIDQIDYEIFKKFIEELQQTKYTHITKQNFGVYNGYKNRIDKKDITEIHLLVSNSGKEYFNLIKSSLSTMNSEASFDIEDINSYQRMIIYLICKFFSLEYKTIKTNQKILVPCTDFLPCNKGVPRYGHQTKDVYGDELVCGCDFAPSWFHNNHFDNNYEDTISYSYTYRIRSTGIKITKN